MKKTHFIYHLLLAALIFTGVELMADQKNFSMKLTLLRKETSKDSNWRKEKITISGNTITMNLTYGGFKAPENTKCNKKVSDNFILEIKEYLLNNNFFNTIKESKKSDGIGISGHLMCEIEVDDKTYIINISGKTRIWGSGDYIKKHWGKQFVLSKTNIKNISYFGKTRFIINKIKSHLNCH